MYASRPRPFVLDAVLVESSWPVKLTFGELETRVRQPLQPKSPRHLRHSAAVCGCVADADVQQRDERRREIGAMSADGKIRPTQGQGMRFVAL